MNDDGIGPFDFLFCERCERHIKRAPLFDLKVVRIDYLTEENRRDRIAQIHIRASPSCPDCGGKLVQKYFTVTINI